MKEIFIYWFIGPFLAEQFATQMNEFAKNDEVTVTLNSPGGDVYSGWSMISRISKHEGKKNLRIEGHAASMAPIFIPFFDHVTALNVTQFFIHRADGMVRNETDQKSLDDINQNLLLALKSRIDEARFTEITGETLDGIFNAREQFDVFLNAEQAREVGLVDEVIDMYSESGVKEVQASQKKFVAFSNKFLTLQPKAHKIIIPQAHKKQIKSEDMSKENLTVAEIKAQHPNVFDEIFKAGVESEKDRVLAYLEFMDIDPKTVRAGIEAGKPMTQADMAKLIRMSASGPGAQASIEENANDNADAVQTEEPTGSAQPGTEVTETNGKAAKIDDKKLSPQEKAIKASKTEAENFYKDWQAKRKGETQTV